MAEKERGLTYAQAGVDIDAGNRMVELIKPLVRATARAGADAEIGGFGGLFDLKRLGMTDPILVAATDGVGTKVKIAIETGRHDTIGIDLVAISVNDLVVQGAEPLFFLDYYACGKLEPEIGALYHQVVDAHGDQIDANGVVAAGLDGDLDLGADAVGGRHQDRIGHAQAFEVEQAAEAADFRVRPGARGGAYQRLDQLHHPVAGIDIDACLRVSEAALLFCHDGPS